MKKFAERLVAARKSRNITQKKLSEMLGITATRLNYWEKGTREPDIDMIKKLSQALSVNPNFLIGMEEWEADNYEDLENARSNEEELHIFCNEGVPDSLVGRYLWLSAPQPETETSEVYPDEWETTLILKSRALNKAGKKALSDHLDLLLSSEKHRSE